MKDKNTSRIRRSRRTRHQIKQVQAVRLTVHRSNTHIYAQVIDATGSKVLASASTVEPEVRKSLKNGGNVEAAILIGKRIAEQLIYLSLADSKKAGKPMMVNNAVELAQQAADKLKQRIIRFDDEKTPYLSRVRPQFTDSVGYYDHLARVREWSASGEDA